MRVADYSEVRPAADLQLRINQHASLEVRQEVFNTRRLQVLLIIQEVLQATMAHHLPPGTTSPFALQ